MDRLKMWLYNFWQDFKQDWLLYIMMFFFVGLILFFLVGLIYCIVSGQLSDDGRVSHGIYMIPMYNGNNVTFLPMPY